MRPTLFLDCDGVLNHERGADGVLRPEDIELIEGAGRAVAALNRAGILAIGVTNRAQVARGKLTEAALHAILIQLCTLIGADGGTLDGLFYCPHLPPPAPDGANPAYIVDCDCRKPKPGLLEQAAAALPVDRNRAAMVGDSTRDIAAAAAFGIPAWGVFTGHACADADEPSPALWFDSVVDAARHAVLRWGSTSGAA